jgi:hypothetical protein
LQIGGIADSFSSLTGLLRCRNKHLGL